MSANLPNYSIRKVMNGAAVASTGSATSDVFKCENGEAFTVWAKATSAGGTADVKIDLYQTPVTGVYVSGDPVTVTAIDASDVTEDWSIYVNTTVNGLVAAQYWVKVTGVNANPADTLATVYVSMRY